MKFEDLSLEGKKVLLRVDFNVPLNDEGEVMDDTRIRMAVPTINDLLARGAAVVITSHLGRPEKDRFEDGSLKRAKYSLVHVVNDLSSLLDRNVSFVDDTIGPKVNGMIDNLKPGEVLLLENTRFYSEEKQGDIEFAKELAAHVDVYVNDAFGTAHREHASTATVAKFFDKEHKSFGLLMDRELTAASKLTQNPDHPVVAIIGGAKISDKIQLVKNLIPSVDALIIGGGMAYTFIKAQGGEVGNSLVELDKLELAKEIMNYAQQQNTELILPIDSVCARTFSNEVSTSIFPSNAIPDDYMGLDIGPEAAKAMSAIIVNGRTIFWNGPMGVFEMSNFADGTKSIAQAVAEATNKGAYSLIGGGDSVAAIHDAGLADQVSFISTGGGAMLSLLEGSELPGILAIEE